MKCSCGTTITNNDMFDKHENMGHIVSDSDVEVVYTLTATVDGEEVFVGEYGDTAALQEELHKVEVVVEQSLDEVKAMGEIDE